MVLPDPRGFSAFLSNPGNRIYSRISLFRQWQVFSSTSSANCSRNDRAGLCCVSCSLVLSSSSTLLSQVRHVREGMAGSSVNGPCSTSFFDQLIYEIRTRFSLLPSLYFRYRFVQRTSSVLLSRLVWQCRIMMENFFAFIQGGGRSQLTAWSSCDGQWYCILLQGDNYISNANLQSMSNTYHERLIRYSEHRVIFLHSVSA